MAPSSKRDAYSNAIDKVRAQHANTVGAAKFAVECPRCGTKQVIQDVPGMRVCIKCGHEFRKVP